MPEDACVLDACFYVAPFCIFGLFPLLRVRERISGWLHSSDIRISAAC